MPFIDTDDSGWVNSDYIVSILRGEFYHYSVPDTFAESRPSQQTWVLTIVMRDGTQHKVTGERSALAISTLGLPTRLAWNDFAAGCPKAESIDLPATNRQRDELDEVPESEPDNGGGGDCDIATNLFHGLEFDKSQSPRQSSQDESQG